MTHQKLDREKVIKDLSELTEFLFSAYKKAQTEKEIAECYERFLMADNALDLLKEQEAIIEQYRRADGFLAVHGWKWESR